MSFDLAQLSPAKRALLERRLRGELETRTVAGIPHRLSEGPAPASFGQRQMWFLTQVAGASTVYNEAVTIHCPADADPACLELAFNEVLRRHEVWRTLLRPEGDDLVQVVTPFQPVRLPLVDLRPLERDNQIVEANRTATEDAHRPFDHRNGPMWRAMLVRLDDACRLHLTLRHIIFDGVSVYRVLLPELIALYDAFRAERPSPLPEPPVQYGDYAAWQRERARGPEAARQLEYWRRQLRDVPPLLLPTDRPRPAEESFRGSFHSLELTAELTDRLRALGRSVGASLFMTTLAGFLFLLQRLAGQEDLVVGTVTSGRRRPELEGLLGYFLNSLALRSDLSGDPTFRELMLRVRDTTLAALANDEVPFEHVVQALGGRRQGTNPLFQVVFSLEPPLPDPPRGWNLTQMDVDTGTSKFDLYVELDERPQGLIGRFIYRTDLFDRPTVERMAAQFAAVLELVVAEPDRRLSELPLPGGRAEAPLRGPAPAVPEQNIGQRFEEVARRWPERVALSAGVRRLTYAEVERRSRQLALRLRDAGLRQGERAGVMMERSLEMVIAVLAVLRAGGAYVPLDRRDPDRRLDRLASEAGVRVLVTTGEDGERLGTLPRVLVDKDAEPSTGVRLDAAGPDDLAYVLFTSGSTGAPKGVMVEQRSILRLVCPSTYAELGPDQVLLQLAPLAFDASTFEIWGALLNGARLEVAPPGLLSARELGQAIEGGGVTTLWLTAGLFSQMVDAGLPGFRSVRQLLTGGEAPSVPHCRRALELLPGVRLINGYGPTEATTFTCCHTITREDLEGGSIPIGRPIGNTTVYLLDEGGRPVAEGSPGELWVGGPGVARGYLGAPELTRERFPPDPDGGAGSRRYRTGDIVRRRRDGALEFVGRRDRQVKVRGFRIELGEIENALREHPSVADAVVEAPEVEGQGRRLAAYVAASQGAAQADRAELHGFLAARLPGHMLPDAYVAIPTVPLKANGKVDRSALPPITADALTQDTGRRLPAGAPLPTLAADVGAVWASVLGLDQVDPGADFFALGGHSLLAVRMIAEVERRFDCSLSLSVIFGEGATAVGLARLIEDAHPVAAAGGTSIAIRAGGTKLPLFVIEPNQQSVVALRNLMPGLDPERPVTALLPPTPEGRFDRESSIEELAQSLLRVVRAAQPAGPYHLAGYSLGGYLAYEMAARLRAAGEDVRFCGLIDVMTPAAAVAHSDPAMSLGTRLWRLALTRPTRWPGMFQGGLRRVTGREPPVDGDSTFDADGALALVTAYEPPHSDTPLTVFGSRWQQRWVRDRSLGWGAVHHGSLRTFTIPGDHSTMLLEPNVTVLAVRMAEELAP
ncbi:MAG TPA: amino acid adenylation domain-containing protein [Candidatus Dormibacteraeota bacterium]|nr:amino acid adenylation domain-containing protein [Candidatus Dormibacteraeota bacterium]